MDLGGSGRLWEGLGGVWECLGGSKVEKVWFSFGFHLFFMDLEVSIGGGGVSLYLNWINDLGGVARCWEVSERRSMVFTDLSPHTLSHARASAPLNNTMTHRFN